MNVFRNLMIANNKKHQYALTSTGTQYIDTQYIPNTNTRIKCKFEVNGYRTTGNTDTTGFIFGARTSSLVNRCCFATTPSNVSFYQFGTSSTTAQVDSAPALNTIHTVELSTDNYLLDGVKKIPYSSGIFTAPNSMYLFANHQNGALDNRFSIATIYKVEIWDKGVLVRDFIPVPKGDTQYSEIQAPSNCIWCMVTKKYYENKGTGSFGIKVIPQGLITDGLLIHYNVPEQLTQHSQLNKFINLAGYEAYDGIIQGYNVGNWRPNGYLFDSGTFIEIPLYLDDLDEFTIEIVYSASQITTANVVIPLFGTVGGNNSNRLGFFEIHESVPYLTPRQLGAYKNKNGAANTADTFLKAGVLPSVGQFFNSSIVKKQEKGSLYYNGVLKDSLPNFFNYPIIRLPLRLGRSADGNYSAQGVLAKVAIYTRALSDNEISQNYLYDRKVFGI